MPLFDKNLLSFEKAPLDHTPNLLPADAGGVSVSGIQPFGPPASGNMPPPLLSLTENSTGTKAIKEFDAQVFLNINNLPSTFAGANHFWGQDPLTGIDQRETRSSADLLPGKPAQQPTVREIVFVDAVVEDYQSLVAGIPAGAEVVILEPNRNGAVQITEVLAQRTDISAVHIVSHGEPGSLKLGNSTLNLAGIAQTQQWANALSPDADILIYGCDVASGAQGEAFVEKLRELTGADVAASTDKTGSAIEGGDWLLEYGAGQIETDLAFNEPARSAYDSVFAIINSIGQASLASNATFGGTLIGGLSGITYNSANNAYYVIADARNNSTSPGPVRFYTFNINVSSGTLAAGGATATGVTLLGNPARFAANTSDTEGIALAPGGTTAFISSEGVFNGSTIVQPFINQFTIATGTQTSALPVPSKFTATVGTSGIVNNAAFESLSISPDGQFLFTATENALKQDGAVPTASTGTPSRILTYNLGTSTAGAEYLYNTQAGNGISEILALDSTTLLVLERSMNPAAQTGSLRLYQVSLTSATDISGLNALIGSPTAVQKTLVADFQTTAGFPINNFEGMTLGPTLPSGKRSLILISDNNYGAGINLATTVAAFSVNSAPVLDNTGNISLTAIDEDPTINTGTLISTLIGSSITELDTSDAKGIAVTGLDTTNGIWQYSTDGSIWTGFGTPSESAAMLLASDANTRIRFVPNANYNGVAGNITFRAWDGTTGTNGTTADITTSGTGGLASFSTATETASINVNAVNDGPVVTVPDTQTIDQNTNLAISGISIADIDAGIGNLQVTLSATNGSLNLSALTGLTFSTGDGTADASMTFTGSLTNINTALAALTYRSSANYSGPATVNLNVSDLGNTGTGGALTASGSIALNITSVLPPASINSADPSLKVQGVEDFNSDGKADILWRNETTGENQIWLMDGQTVTSTNSTNSTGTNWKVAGVEDFNGDGNADILWRDEVTGNNQLWQMNGSSVTSRTSVYKAAANWKVQATDDFNGDSKADILWRDPVTGQNSMWLMDGSTRLGSKNISGAEPRWQVRSTDDFNGDSKADILWRDPVTGQNAIWLMDGMAVTSGKLLLRAYAPLEVEDTDDFNADGKADILWRNSTTGENTVWLIDGTTVSSTNTINSAASRWQVQGVSDFNNDNQADVLWRDEATGENAMWLMTGLTNPSGPLV